MVTYIINIICLLIAFLSVVPLSLMILLWLYTAPYCIWIGWQHGKGMYKELDNFGFRRNARNATKLYFSWILHKAPVFR